MRTPLPNRNLEASVKHLLRMQAEARETLARAATQNTANPFGAPAQVSAAAQNAVASVDLMRDLRGGD